MKLAAYVAATKNDGFLLERLIEHNLKSCDVMYVLDHGLTKEERKMVQSYDKVVSKRVRKKDITISLMNWFSDLIKEWQKKLLKRYDWVLYSCADEFVVANPSKYKNLKEFLKDVKEDYACCQGYNVHQIRQEEQPLDPKKKVLAQRKYWCRHRAYNKPLLSSVPLEWVIGQHKLKDESDDDQHKRGHKDLYLLHLKHVDFDLCKPRLLRINPDLGVLKQNFDYHKNPLELIPEKFKKVI